MSAGSGNIYTSGEKDISGFTETGHINTVAPIGVKLQTQVNPEDKEMD